MLTTICVPRMVSTADIWHPMFPLRTGFHTAEDGVFPVDMETDIPTIIDVRCDLHARLVWGGEYISFDTTHNGRRDIAVLPSDGLDF